MPLTCPSPFLRPPSVSTLGFPTHTQRSKKTGQIVYKTQLVANVHSFKQNLVRN